MTYISPNLRLITYDIVSDGGVLTGSYVEAVSGSTIASDLMKIDRFAGEVSACIATSSSTIWGLSASIITTSASFNRVVIDKQGRVTSGCVIEPDGNIWIPSSSFYPSATNGAYTVRKAELPTSGNNIYLMDFSGSIVQYAEIMFSMPNDWSGTPLSASFVWLSASMTVGAGAVWGIMGNSYYDENDLTDVFFNRYASEGGASGSAVWAEVTDLATSPCYCQVTPSTGYFRVATKRASGSPLPGDICHLIIRRSASATLDTGDGYGNLMGVKINYKRSTL